MSYSRTQNPSFSRTRRGRGNTAAASNTNTRGNSVAASRGNLVGIGHAMNPPVSQSSHGYYDESLEHQEDLNADRSVEGEGRSEGRAGDVSDDRRREGTERTMQRCCWNYIRLCENQCIARITMSYIWLEE